MDCASDYGNEKEVGQGIKKAIDAGLVCRQDLWITSKLWNTYHEPQYVKAACQKSLEDLGLTYLDLYLIHFPISLKFVPFETRYPPEWFHDPNTENPRMELIDVPVQDTWKAMESLVQDGLVNHIGLSNFNASGLRDVWSYAKVKSSVLHIELHPYLQQWRLLRYAQSLGLHVTAYSPMGHGASYFNDSIAAIREPIVKELAQKHVVSEAQIVLRFGNQRRCSVIPKSNHLERIEQNLNIFGFDMTTEEMEKMKSLDRHLRFNDPAIYCEKFFNTFCTIFD